MAPLGPFWAGPLWVPWLLIPGPGDWPTGYEPSPRLDLGAYLIRYNIYIYWPCATYNTHTDPRQGAQVQNRSAGMSPDTSEEISAEGPADVSAGISADVSADVSSFMWNESYLCICELNSIWAKDTIHDKPRLTHATLESASSIS